MKNNKLGHSQLSFSEFVRRLDMARFKLDGNVFRPVKRIEIVDIHSLREILDQDPENISYDFDRLSLNERYATTLYAIELYESGLLDAPIDAVTGQKIAELFCRFKSSNRGNLLTLMMAYATYIYLKSGLIHLAQCKIDPQHRDLQTAGRYHSGRPCPVCQSRMRPAADLVERFAEFDARRDIISGFIGGKFLADYTIRALNRSKTGRGGMTGKQPSSPEFYTKTAIRRHEATILCRYLTDSGLVSAPLLDINEGHLFITVYETYCREAKRRSYDINRCYYLLERLRRRDVTLVTCNQCGQDSIRLNTKITPSYCASCDIQLRETTPGRRPQSEYYTLPDHLVLAG